MFAKDSSAFLIGNKIKYFVQKNYFDFPRIFEFRENIPVLHF